MAQMQNKIEIKFKKYIYYNTDVYNSKVSKDYVAHYYKANQKLNVFGFIFIIDYR